MKYVGHSDIGVAWSLSEIYFYQGLGSVDMKNIIFHNRSIGQTVPQKILHFSMDSRENASLLAYSLSFSDHGD
jgi:hypothetical protein